MQRYNLPALVRAKRSTKRTIRPIRLDPVGHSATVEFDLFVIANQFMRALEREILSQLMPVVFAEVAAMRARAGDVMMRDDAGANARAVISYLKVRAAISGADVLTKATGSIQAEGVRHTRKWTASINAGTSVDVSALLRDDDLVDVLSLRSGEFNSLITNLGNSTLERIERQTLGAIFEGRSNADIEKALRETIGLSKARAKLIARDQASKLNGAMNEFRQRQAGVTHYTWRTVLDGRERDTHRARNGKVFPWDRPPGGGHPGSEINCRCRASAVLIDDEADAAEISEVDDPPDFDAASELLGRVREMSRSDLLSLPREALLLKRAEVQTARQFVGASKSAASAEDIERTFEAVFGFPSAGQDLVKMSGVGTVVGALRSRRSLMLAAIESRIDLVDDILAHAVETAPN